MGTSFNSVQKATNSPPCGAGNSRKCPTPGATEDVPHEFEVKEFHFQSFQPCKTGGLKKKAALGPA